TTDATRILNGCVADTRRIAADGRRCRLAGSTGLWYQPAMGCRRAAPADYAYLCRCSLEDGTQGDRTFRIRRYPTCGGAFSAGQSGTGAIRNACWAQVARARQGGPECQAGYRPARPAVRASFQPECRNPYRRCTDAA